MFFSLLFLQLILPEWLFVQNNQSACFDSEGLTPNTNDSTCIIIVTIGTFWHDITPPTQEGQKHHHTVKMRRCEVRCFYISRTTVLFYIPGSLDPPSTLQESPTRFPPTRPKSKAKDPSVKESDIKSETGMKTKQKYCLENM